MKTLSPSLQAHYERLAPYLPYAVQVYHKAHGIGTLIGLPYCADHECPRAEVYFPAKEDGHGPYEEYFELEEVTLCLRPFEALVQPELAKALAMLVCVDDGHEDEDSYSRHDFSTLRVSDQHPDFLPDESYSIKWDTNIGSDHGDGWEHEVILAHLIVNRDGALYWKDEDGTHLLYNTNRYLRKLHLAVRGLPAGSYRVLAAEAGKEVAPHA